MRSNNKKWPLARKGKKYGPNTQPYVFSCAWCREQFRCARPEAITCCNAHRSALARYIAKHDQPPRYAFGLKPDKKQKKPCRPRRARPNDTPE